MTVLAPSTLLPQHKCQTMLTDFVDAQTLQLNSPLSDLEAFVASPWLYSVDPQLSSFCSFFGETRSDTLCTSTKGHISYTNDNTPLYIWRKTSQFHSSQRLFLQFVENRGRDVLASLVVKYNYRIFVLAEALANVVSSSRNIPLLFLHLLIRYEDMVAPPH